MDISLIERCELENPPREPWQARKASAFWRRRKKETQTIQTTPLRMKGNLKNPEKTTWGHHRKKRQKRAQGREEEEDEYLPTPPDDPKNGIPEQDYETASERDGNAEAGIHIGNRIVLICKMF